MPVMLNANFLGEGLAITPSRAPRIAATSAPATTTVDVKSRSLTLSSPLPPRSPAARLATRRQCRMRAQARGMAAAIACGSITACGTTDLITKMANASGARWFWAAPSRTVPGVPRVPAIRRSTTGSRSGSTITAAASTYLGSTNNTASVPDAGAGANVCVDVQRRRHPRRAKALRPSPTRPGRWAHSGWGCTVTTNTGCGATGNANVVVHLPFATRNLAVIRLGDGSAALTSAGTAEFGDQGNSTAACSLGL